MLLHFFSVIILLSTNFCEFRIRLTLPYQIISHTRASLTQKTVGDPLAYLLFTNALAPSPIKLGLTFHSCQPEEDPSSQKLQIIENRETDYCL